MRLEIQRQAVESKIENKKSSQDGGDIDNYIP